MALPSHYHSLRPFRPLFSTGVPALMYHKLGPRPRRVRLKGLYMSARLFRRQLAELRDAEFVTPRIEGMFPANGNPRREIVLTFDDGFLNVLRHGLGPLAEFQFNAIEFLVSDLLGKTNEWDLPRGEVSERLMGPAEVREWISAGHEIGSHTRTHPLLTRLSRDRAREEIVGSRKALQDLFGRPIEHFCYPYGDWNDVVRDLVVEAGYKTAFTTAPGVNTVGQSAFELRRFTARYPSRKLKAIWSRLWIWNRRNRIAGRDSNLEPTL